MHSFLLCAGLSTNEEALERRLVDAMANASTAVPLLEGEHSLCLVRLPSVQGAVAIAGETGSRLCALDTLETPELFVGVHGDAQHAQSPAAAVADAFGRGGYDAVRLLQGSFAVIVVDKKEGSVTLLTDCIGKRSLRYVSDAGSVFVSPHDVVLAASGADCGTYDLASALSMIGVDWSIGGRPLLRKVCSTQSFSMLRWKQGRLRALPSPLVTSESRLSDDGQVRDYRARMVDCLQRSAEGFLARVPVARVGITAGKDSRCVLALMASLADRDKVTAFTSGEAYSLDVRVGARLATLAGIAHERVMPTPADPDGFAAHCRYLAFYNSGDTNAKRALVPLEPPNEEAPVAATGVGGELFTGYYYKVARDGRLPNQLEDIELSLGRHFKRLAKLPASECLRKEVESRLFMSLQRLWPFASHGSDVLDLFYLCERYARWGGHSARRPHANTWAVFDNIEALRLAYQLPPPIGLNAGIHSAILKTCFPIGYLMPINGSTLMLLDGPGTARRLSRRILQKLSRARRRLRLHDTRRGSTEEARSDLLAGPLYDFTHSTLLASGSISRQILGEKPLQSLLSEHRSRSCHAQALGFMLTIEHWRAQVEAVRRRATS